MKKFVFLPVVILLLAACSTAEKTPIEEPTNTPIPPTRTSTPVPPTPTETNTPTPTDTPEPTVTSTPTEEGFDLPLPEGQPLETWRGVPIMPGALKGDESEEDAYFFTIISNREEIEGAASGDCIHSRDRV